MFVVTILLSLLGFSFAAEFTFELPDRQRQCFYENLKSGDRNVVEYQVISGGNYDVDIVIKDPSNNIIYNKERKQYESHSFIPSVDGIYQICFSNEFSSITHKTVYFDWQTTERKGQFEKNKSTALTFMETSTVNLQEALNNINEEQTHIRLRESIGRYFAEELNHRVLYWSIGQAILIVTVGIGQVFMLRSFFHDKRPVVSYGKA